MGISWLEVPQNLNRVDSHNTWNNFWGADQTKNMISCVNVSLQKKEKARS
jgi:hypothetical protein